MLHEDERGRPSHAGENDAMIFALPPDAGGDVQFAQARIDPITVPRPQAWDTVTIGVIPGRSLKLEFGVDEVKTREVVQDDLVLGFENGGKVVLKDYMHAFGLLGEQRTTIIQPDGKHYPLTELLSPTAAPRVETPATPTPPDVATPSVVIIRKPPAGETESVTLSPDKLMLLDFGIGDVARSQVKDGNLVLTFKDKGVLVLEGYAALKDNADIALYFARGEKVSLADLAPGAGPADTGAEGGGHFFTEFVPGGLPGPLAHLGPLKPEPFDLVPPTGPPESPPPTSPPPNLPPPQPVKDCEPPLKDCAHDPKDQGDGRKDHGPLTWVNAPGCEIAGDAHWVGGRWGEAAGGKAETRADEAHRGWINGHDDSSAANSFHHAQHLGAQQVDHGALMHHADEGTDESGWVQQGHQAALSSHNVFDAGAPAHAGDHGGHRFAAAQDLAAVTAHSESHAPEIQHDAQHNVMGHG